MNVNYVSQYLAAGLHGKNEYQLGSCVDIGITYGMELRAILTRQPVRMLSQIFCGFNSHLAEWPNYLSMNPRPNGGSPYYACQQAQQLGVSEEYLWPLTMCGDDDYVLCNVALTTKPGSPAYTDAAYQKLTGWTTISTWSQAETALAAGQPVGFLKPGNNHFVCGMGIDSTARMVYGLETSGSDGQFMYSYDILSPYIVIQSVSFGPKPQATLTPAMIAQVQSLQASVTMPVATVDVPWTAQLNALAAKAQIPPPQPQPPAPPSPDGTTYPPTPVVDAQGATWTLGTVTVSQYGYAVLKNGAQWAGGQGTLIQARNGIAYTMNAANQWWQPTATGWTPASATK